MIGPPGQESLLREILALWRAAPAIAESLPSKMAPKKKSKPTSSGEQPAASSAAPAEFTVPSADKVAIPLPPCDACNGGAVVSRWQAVSSRGGHTIHRKRCILQRKTRALGGAGDSRDS